MVSIENAERTLKFALTSKGIALTAAERMVDNLVAAVILYTTSRVKEWTMSEKAKSAPTRTPSRTEARRVADKYISWILEGTNDRGRLDDADWETVAQRIEDDLQGRTFDAETS